MGLPFFLKTDPGERFCIYHAPEEGTEVRGAFVYIHPFAEEMNKARRMAALQSRAFARAGIAVLQIDLFGCGDSSGDFGDARWDIWKDDVLSAATWLERRVSCPVGLWGLRLGALLALDVAHESNHQFDRLILWQPVTSGETYLTQFLRMRLAGDMLANGSEKSGGTQELRKRMATGESLEVAGYVLSPAIATCIDGLNATKLVPEGTPVHWFELVSEDGRPMPPAAARVAAAMEERGARLNRYVVSGPAFWSTQEITECHPLVAATTGVLDEVNA